MHCSYCCFKNRKDKVLEMPFDVLKEGIFQFYSLGVRAVEITGGGEPTLYPYINQALRLLDELGIYIGMNTNAVDSQFVRCWDLCEWVRVSLNTLDYYDSINTSPILDSGAYISGCYIWNDKSTEAILDKVIRFADDNQVVCRIAPDCIKPLVEIDRSVDQLRDLLLKCDSEYVFLSDFNIDTTRHNHKCYIHMIKPCFYTDGYIYPCPSMELAHEHDHRMNERYRVCRYNEVVDFYQSEKPYEIKELTCSYCKYAKQQIVLEDVLTKTIFNEFA